MPTYILQAEAYAAFILLKSINDTIMRRQDLVLTLVYVHSSLYNIMTTRLLNRRLDVS